jgi:synaptobrevin family protein YKT6
MKITAILVLKAPAVQGGESRILSNLTDVWHFGFFQRAKEFILFASRTIAGRTPLGQRQSVEQDGEFL